MKKILLASVLALPLVVSAQSLSNGGFELTIPTGPSVGLNFDQDDHFYYGSPLGPQAGEKFVEFFIDSGAAWVKDQFILAAATPVKLSFFLARPSSGAGNPVDASWSLVVDNTTVASGTVGALSRDDTWIPMSATTGSLAAGIHTVTFNFTAPDGVGNDLGLDSLSVTAVPEPESYALMLAGLAAVGFLARRRKGA